MSLNLGNAVDFARATNSLAGNALAQIQNVLDRTRGVREWVIQEASYDGIKFHIFKEALPYRAGMSQVVDQGGRRKAIIKLPYVDGQSTDDMGRDGYSWTFDAIIHGTNYRDGLKLLKDRMDLVSTPADLIHPVYGRLRAVPQSWTITHESNTRQAATLRLEFIEHNFDVGAIVLDENDDGSGNLFKNAIAAALQFVARVGAIIDKVNATANLGTSFVNTLRRDLLEVQLSLRNNLISVNAAFNTDGTTDLPGALPVNNGGSRTTDPTGDGDASTISVVNSPNDPFLGLRGTTAQVPILSPQQIVDNANVYRDSIEATILLFQQGGLELDFYEDILTLQASATAMQKAIETGIQSSRPRVIQYTVPREMSVREVAFLNGLSPDRGGEIDQLNPMLDSLNVIPKGTLLLIPTSRG